MALLGMNHLLKEGSLARPGFSLLWLHLWGRLRVDPGDKAQAFLEHPKILAWNPSRKELRGRGIDTHELVYSPLSLHLVLTIPWLLLFVGQSCLTLCDPMDCSMQGFPVFQNLPESSLFFRIFPVLQNLPCSNLCPLSLWCYLTISSSVILFSSCPQSFPHQGLSHWVSTLHQVAILECQL